MAQRGGGAHPHGATMPTGVVSEAVPPRHWCYAVGHHGWAAAVWLPQWAVEVPFRLSKATPGAGRAHSRQLSYRAPSGCFRTFCLAPTVPNWCLPLRT